MNRQIVYPGAIPLETDLLNTNKYAMLGLAKLASSLMGGNTYVHGLACTPSSPASMVVNVAAGQIYSLQNIDGTAYSSLPADTTHSILKQGYVLDAQQFTLIAPSTSGYSINYLIQATYTDVDGGSTVLPYYNATNPSVAWSGPNNSGTPQYTVRQGVCTVSLKAGVAATTGTQVTPSPDSGCIGLYVITVAQGATTVTAGNIVTYANAPFLPQGGIVDGIQRNTMTYAADSGVANAYVVNINPGILTLSDGMVVNFKASNANTTSSTLNVCALGAYPVLNKFGQTLISGEIAAGSHVTVKWSASASSWFVLESTLAIPTAPTASSTTNSTQIATTAFVKNSALTKSLNGSDIPDAGSFQNNLGLTFSGTTLSFVSHGPGLMIQQGGKVTAPGGTGNFLVVNFPQAFPNGCIAAFAIFEDGTYSQTPFEVAIVPTSTNMTVGILSSGGSIFFNGRSIRWFAVGF
ncbi:gp53-like domain-containing protein [Enterobacter asburiae]